MKKQEVAVIGIVCITALESVAMLTGHDGTLFAAVVGGIGAMVGLCFGIGLKKEASQ